LQRAAIARLFFGSARDAIVRVDTNVTTDAAVARARGGPAGPLTDARSGVTLGFDLRRAGDGDARDRREHQATEAEHEPAPSRHAFTLSKADA